jgi:hypothetical protein
MEDCLWARGPSLAAVGGICVRQHLTPRVLVTGGAGFLGSHLCDRLIADGASGKVPNADESCQIKGVKAYGVTRSNF